MALSQDRQTRKRIGDRRAAPVAAATKIYLGALVALNAAGDLVPGSVATTLKSPGVAVAQVDNTGGAAGAVTAEYEKGIFQFKNSAAGDAITRADIGANCYIVDDETVAKTNGTNTRSVAGVIEDVDAQGVYVRFE